MLPLHVSVAHPLTEAILTGVYAVVVWGLVTAYLVGESSLRRGGSRRGSRRLAQPLAFLSGTAAVTLTLLPPVGTLLERNLAGHMVQHMVLIMVAAPLLVLGRPGPRLMRALGPQTAGRVVRASRSRAGRGAAAVVESPTVAWVGFGMVLWAWHAPTVFDWAARSAPAHALQHASLLAVAVLAVRTLTASARRRELPLGFAVVALAATGMHSAVLGALLVFTRRPVYPVYADHPVARVLADQQLAGVLMWVGAAPVFLGAVCAVVLRALHDPEVAPPVLVAHERTAT
jgi:putative membrane protein